MKAPRIGVVAAILLLAACLPSAGLTAGEATAAFESEDGATRIRVRIADPSGEVTLDHFRSLRFGLRSSGGGVPGSAFALTRDSETALSLAASRRARGSTDETGRFLPDWSGVTAAVTIESIGACIAGIYGEVEGTIQKGKSGYLIVENTMSHVSVLTSMRGDADLYVYDAVGTLLCVSDLSPFDRLPDTCAYLASDCGTVYIPQSLVEIRGLRKRNDFHLTIWAVDAI